MRQFRGREGFEDAAADGPWVCYGGSVWRSRIRFRFRFRPRARSRSKTRSRRCIWDVSVKPDQTDPWGGD